MHTMIISLYYKIMFISTVNIKEHGGVKSKTLQNKFMSLIDIAHVLLHILTGGLLTKLT